MGLFGKRKEKERPLSQMGESDRERAIASYEESRDDVIFQIEDLMNKIAAESGRRRWRARKRKTASRADKR